MITGRATGCTLGGAPVRAGKRPRRLCSSLYRYALRCEFVAPGRRFVFPERSGGDNPESCQGVRSFCQGACRTFGSILSVNELSHVLSPRSAFTPELRCPGQRSYLSRVRAVRVYALMGCRFPGPAVVARVLGPSLDRASLTHRRTRERPSLLHHRSDVDTCEALACYKTTVIPTETVRGSHLASEVKVLQYVNGEWDSHITGRAASQPCRGPHSQALNRAINRTSLFRE